MVSKTMKKEKNETGYVYILINPSFREDWVKIGKSARPVDIRSKELDNTAVPLPFEIFATMETVKYNEVERLVHKTIDRLTDLRIRQNREFFNVAPQIALDILKDIALTIDDAKIVEYEGNKPKLPEKASAKDLPLNRITKRPRFKFSMVGIQIGEYIKFEPTGIKVKVASDDSVEYDNRIYKLSPFVGTFLPDEKRTPSNAYQGAKFSSPIMERSWLICERKWKMLKMRKVLVTNNHDCYRQESLSMTNQMNDIQVVV